MELLFCYGTLQQTNLQLANFGRTLSGAKDARQKYKIGNVKITDVKVITESGKDIHPILRYADDPRNEVTGTVFEITAKKLVQADDYEVDDYKRISAALKSGKCCWIYAANDDS
jgi:gamma-glutamylcyclotransferase (GGCT)/AIG2-like uncharacterized protein YtfP